MAVCGCLWLWLCMPNANARQLCSIIAGASLGASHGLGPRRTASISRETRPRGDMGFYLGYKTKAY